MHKRFFQLNLRQLLLLLTLLGLLVATVAPRLRERVQGWRVAAASARLGMAHADFERAIQTDNVELARSAIARGVDPDPLGSRRPIQTVIERGQVDMLKMLLEHGIDTDRLLPRVDGMLSGGGPPLFLVVVCTQPLDLRREMLKALLAHGADVNAVHGQRTAMDHAVFKLDAPMADALREVGAKYGPREMTAFGRLEELKQAVRESPEILGQRFSPIYATRPGQGPTLLGLALSRGYREMAQFLIESGAPLETVEGQGQTLLHLAARGQDPELIRQLVKCGLDVNARDEYEDTPLTDCAWRVNLATIEVLLECGADVNAYGSRGDTALHHVLRHRHWRHVAPLVAAGTDPTLPNRAGETAFDLARDAPPEIQDLLRSAGEP